ncbi:hypothetical protein [Sinorhizobium meliloti]|uniref:hypothetical protein n=1 Tax=Rhizobium meliloti TaxID=382 RepID=UPI0039892464
MAALSNAGCEVIREEQKSDVSLEGRPQLMTILDFIHAGETLCHHPHRPAGQIVATDLRPP